jgi:hypothetical protein
MNTRAARTILLTLLAVSGACLHGCAVLAYLAVAFAPPRKIPALYEPPEGKKFLVFVDDLQHGAVHEPVKQELTNQLNRMLVDNDVAASIIPYDDLLDLITVTPKFNRLAVNQVGQKLGADVVLYVRVDKFSVKDDDVSPLWHGQLEATVRVVDARTSDPAEVRMWPKDDPEGHRVEPVEIPPETNSSPGFGDALSRKMAGQMADRVAKFFYEHEESQESR